MAPSGLLPGLVGLCVFLSQSLERCLRAPDTRAHGRTGLSFGAVLPGAVLWVPVSVPSGKFCPIQSPKRLLSS